MKTEIRTDKHVQLESYEGRRGIWEVATRNNDPELPETISPMLAHLLRQRGYPAREEIIHFFADPSPKYDPLLLPDMESTVARIRKAGFKGESVAVYGDFDCDGLTASAIVQSTLVGLGLEPLVVVPTRQDGHGIRSEKLDELAATGVTLVVTVDCGIGDVRQIAHARSLGMDVIVTDHHLVNADGILPDALVVSASRSDSVYPWPYLSGAGVAYKLAEAILGAERAAEFLDLVVLGTVADVVPLRDENRTLVTRGLASLKATLRPGLRALFMVAGIDTARLNASSIGFYLGPRLNVANRLADPQLAFDLLTATDGADAYRVATILDEHNSTRQELVDRNVGELAEVIGPPAEFTKDLHERKRAPMICVSGDWTPGVSGLIASAMSDRYNVPAIAASLRADGLIAASGRSVDGVNILDLVRAAESQLTGAFVGSGGHSMACGFVCEGTQLDSIFSALEQVAHVLVPVDELGSTISIDARVRLSQVDLRSLNLVESLGPYGRDFAEPAFLVRGVYLQGKQQLGRNPRHQKAVARAGDTRVPAILFFCDPDLVEYPEDQPVDLVFNLSRDEWQGTSRPSISVRDWRPFDGDIHQSSE